MPVFRNLSGYTWLKGLIISLLFAAIAVAQTETARIQGTVTDQAGAVIPGATVTITATGTGREIKVQTNAEGSYSALSLQPGAYNVTVTQTNSKPSSRI